MEVLEQYSDDAMCDYDSGGDVDVSDSDEGATSFIGFCSPVLDLHLLLFFGFLICFDIW
jgi:hypothetical protein